jgi:hypothetical protein
MMWACEGGAVGGILSENMIKRFTLSGLEFASDIMGGLESQVDT